MEVITENLKIGIKLIFQKYWERCLAWITCSECVCLIHRETVLLAVSTLSSLAWWLRPLDIWRGQEVGWTVMICREMSQKSDKLSSLLGLHWCGCLRISTRKTQPSSEEPRPLDWLPASYLCMAPCTAPIVACHPSSCLGLKPLPSSQCRLPQKPGASSVTFVAHSGDPATILLKSILRWKPSHCRTESLPPQLSDLVLNTL